MALLVSTHPALLPTKQIAAAIRLINVALAVSVVAEFPPASILLLALALAVMFPVWLFSCYRNLQTLGTDELKFTPRLASLGLIVPLLNLYILFNVMTELWKASNPTTKDPLSWMDTKTSWLVRAWQTSLVLVYATRFFGGQFELGSALISLAFVVIWFELIRQISHRMEQKEKLSQTETIRLAPIHQTINFMPSPVSA